MCSKAKAQPSGMFLTGEDLPLFSRTPVTVHDRGCAAKRDASQPVLPGMPPAEPKRKPSEDLPDLPLFDDLPKNMPPGANPADTMTLDAECCDNPDADYWQKLSQNAGICLPIVNNTIHVLPGCLRNARKTARRWRKMADELEEDTRRSKFCPDLDDPKNHMQKMCVEGWRHNAEEIDRQVAMMKG